MYKNGVKLDLNKVINDGSESFRTYGFDGEFLGISSSDRENNELRIVKNFYNR